METLTSFYAHGKLLLSGEYFVLDGAKALAIPTRYGQQLEVAKGDKTGILSWNSIDHTGNIWLTIEISLDTLQPIENKGESELLIKLLQTAKSLNSSFLKGENAIEATTKLEFPNDWGLGSSSTLISLIAQWAAVDAFELQKACLAGSGYDIACATSKKSILYHLEEQQPKWEEKEFKPPFLDQLYFIHLGKKQNSREGIEHYRKWEGDKPKFTKWISSISEEFLFTENLAVFEDLLVEHEELVSGILDLKMAKQLHFADYWGAIKSLGAWGGDFVLATSAESEQKTKHYFEQKGYSTIIPFREMIV